MVKHLPAMQETWVWSLGQEDTLEKETATHSSILAWKISRTEEPGKLQFTELQLHMTEWLTHTASMMILNQITKNSADKWCQSKVNGRQKGWHFYKKKKKHT